MWTRTLILLSTIYSRYSHRNKLQDAHRFVLLESDEKCWNRESKCFRKKTWKKAGAGEENGTKSVRVQLKRKNSVFMMLRQGLSCYGWCPGFWVWGSLVSGWRTMMEESRWRIKAWPNCLWPANTPPSAERGSLRLARSSSAEAGVLQCCHCLNMTDAPVSDLHLLQNQPTNLLIPNHRFAMAE